MELKKATRKKSFLKLNLSAPSGAGKTYSALLLAKGLVGSWEKIAVIDTENGSASLYSHLGEFLTLDLAPPFSPERYIEALNICINAGIECIIIDSSSHEWSGPGGCIDINERLAAAKYRNNTWSAWNETTPRHDKFVQTVLQCRCHVITCTRSKMETVMGEDKKVKKVGMKDVQREGWEYELTVSLNLDRDTHTAIASKDRTELFEGKDPFVITEKTGQLIAEWCEKGDVLPPAAPIVETLPLITDKMFDQLIERLKGGDSDVITKAKASFTFSEQQKAAVNSVVAELKTPPAEPATLLPAITAAQFKALIKRVTADGVAVMADARKAFVFTAEQETEISKAVGKHIKSAA